MFFPWLLDIFYLEDRQSDCKVMHDGFSNRHSFEFKGRKTILVPMTPKEVHQDQLSLKLKETGTSTKKQSNFFAKAGEVKKALTSKQPLLLFVFKEALTSLSNLAPVLPCCHQLQALNTKLISYQVHLSQTVQHTELTRLRLKNCKNKLMSLWRKATSVRA